MVLGPEPPAGDDRLESRLAGEEGRRDRLVLAPA